MRPSEKFEAKAAGQKCSPEVVFSTLRTFFHLQRRHRALQPAVIERVIGIGSNPKDEKSEMTDAKMTPGVISQRNQDEGQS
jgi:hypothetical protein